MCGPTKPVFSAKSVIVTAPINTWERVSFSPELPASHRAMAAEKQAGESVKVWALVPEQEEGNLFGVGMHTTFKWIASEYTTEEGTYLCCFASAEADLDGSWRPYRPVGCERCGGSGYKGRVGIYQVMPITEEIQRIILSNGNAMQIAEQAQREGVRDLRRSGLMKVIQGLTTIEEVLGVTNE